MSGVHALVNVGGVNAGMSETGRALVKGGCNKLIFIGSTTVGRHVMRDAADRLTPVTLELGGKDPFIICDDADLKTTIPTAMRAAFQSCGQNCVAAERFIVHGNVYDAFLKACSDLTSNLRQGPPLGNPSNIAWCNSVQLSSATNST